MMSGTATHVHYVHMQADGVGAQAPRCMLLNIATYFVVTLAFIDVEQSR